MAKRIKQVGDPSTEERIKEAARAVFTRKGYAATRTRDIAEEAGINLALLNYYFRSKEKLFDLIMIENMQQFLQGMREILNDEKSSLIEKVTAVVERYTFLFKKHPDLPLFMLSEIKAHPGKLAERMNARAILLDSHFFRQILEATDGKMHPIQFLLNVIGLTVFPFAASPLLKAITQMPDEEFGRILEERKALIPVWVAAIMQAT